MNDELQLSRRDSRTILMQRRIIIEQTWSLPTTPRALVPLRVHPLDCDIKIGLAVNATETLITVVSTRAHDGVAALLRLHLDALDLYALCMDA